MFTITIDGKEYKFSFKHQPTVTKSVDDEFPDVPPHTICYVDHCGVISDYYAWLHPNDRYSRETGRKVALAKALKDLFPDDKTTRLEVWMEYFNTLKGKGIKPQKPPTPQKPANDYDLYYLEHTDIIKAGDVICDKDRRPLYTIKSNVAGERVESILAKTDWTHIMRNKPTCDIPEGWYRLDDENEIVKSGDKVLWKIGPTDSTRGEILEHISSINNVSWWLDGITGVDKCVIRRVPPKPEPTNYPIPAGYRKLGSDEFIQKGDAYLQIDCTPQVLPSGFIGSPAKRVEDLVTTHIVLRPIETKMIHGKLMRKLEGDEYPQIGDWWGNDENDPIGKHKSFIIRGKRVSDYCVYPIFWRPVDK